MDMFNDKIQIFLISERLQHPESSASVEFLIIAPSSYTVPVYYLSIPRLHFVPTKVTNTDYDDGTSKKLNLYLFIYLLHIDLMLSHAGSFSSVV